jgi:hypothetical protein
MPQTARVLAAATTIAGSVGVGVLGSGVASAAADTQPIGNSVVSHVEYVSNAVTGAAMHAVRSIPVTTNPLGLAGGYGMLHPLTNVVGTSGSLPLNTAPVTGLLHSNGQLHSLDAVPVVGGLVPSRL